MWASRRSRHYGALLAPLALCLVAASVVACGDEEGPTQPNPPGTFSITAVTMADTVEVSWDAQANVDSFKVEITTNPTLTKWVLGDASEAVFTSADGVEDDADYTASAIAYNAGGSTASSNNPTVTTNFFPWDENFPTSLHYTRIGKATWYEEIPNAGFERFTGIPYQNLGCKDCHRSDQAPGTKDCISCHDTNDPQLGAQVDDSFDSGVCWLCHGRQGAEAKTQQYSDVHRTAGMTCMDCHTLEDMHGDGTAYASMLEDGAIDARCENCHGAAGPGPEPVTTVAEHAQHLDQIDCAVCHSQSVVSCYNCHFESLPDAKRAIGQFKDWIFLVNFRGKVHVANFQSVKWGNTPTDPDSVGFVALAPFYSHTITAQGRTCGVCHDNFGDNPNIDDYNADGVIDIATWNGTGFDHATGVVPVPPDYLTALRFDFADFDGANWFSLKSGADTIQMLYGTPLTAQQMQALGSTR